jgi:hypothetical protein
MTATQPPRVRIRGPISSSGYTLLLLVRTPPIITVPVTNCAHTLRKRMSSVAPGISAVRQPYNSRAIRSGCCLLGSRLSCVSLGLHLVVPFLCCGYLESVPCCHTSSSPLLKALTQSPKTITSLIVNHLRAGSNRFVSVDLAVLKAILPVYTSHKLP